MIRSSGSVISSSGSDTLSVAILLNGRIAHCEYVDVIRRVAVIRLGQWSIKWANIRNWKTIALHPPSYFTIGLPSERPFPPVEIIAALAKA